MWLILKLTYFTAGQDLVQDLDPKVVAVQGLEVHTTVTVAAIVKLQVSLGLAQNLEKDQLPSHQ